MKINIGIPNRFFKERQYAFELLLGYFKNVKVQFTETADAGHYTLSFENGESLLITDSFYRSEPIPRHFPGSIPSKSQVQFAGVSIDNSQYEYVHLYGEKAQIDFEYNTYTIHSDIVASSFFMASGYEEYHSHAEDKHGRFPDEESLPVRAGFYQRPVINEYIELIRKLISKLTCTPLQYNKKYTAYITHDVDEIFRLKPLSKALKRMGGDLLKRRSLPEFLRTVKQTFETLIDSHRDPAYVFNYFMDVSEKYHLKSHFYFICGKPGEVDYQYDIDSKPVVNTIKNMQSRGHHIGFHASYDTPGKFNQFHKELNRLKKACGSDQNLMEGRQHFLRLKIPSVWQHWEAAGMKVDSSMGYHNYCGFRRGICYEYPVFDLGKREKLKLKERPLIFMEVALKREHPDPEKFKKAYIQLVNTVKKYEGDFVFLWHNSNINHPYWRNHAPLYEELVEATTST